MKYELEFLGRPPAKKNTKTPFRKKSGKIGFTYGADQDGLDRLEMQVPGWARDLKLVDPAIEFRFTVADRRGDRDNFITTLLDVLVKQGVLVNDSIAQCNGKITIHPAIVADHWLTVITLVPRRTRRAIC